MYREGGFCLLQQDARLDIGQAMERRTGARARYVSVCATTYWLSAARVLAGPNKSPYETDKRVSRLIQHSQLPHRLYIHTVRVRQQPPWGFLSTYGEMEKSSCMQKNSIDGITEQIIHHGWLRPLPNIEKAPAFSLYICIHTYLEMCII